MLFKTLPLMLVIVSAGIIQVAAPSVAAPGYSPAIGPASSRPGSPANQRANPIRNQDNRSVIVESNLRSINRSLDANRPASPAIPAPSSCPGCGERAPLRPADSHNQDRALRGSLHKLKRETAIQQSADKRRSQIEAAQPEQP